MAEIEQGPTPGAVGLADFLTALRAELADAQRRAEADTDDPLRLRVGPIEVSLEVAFTVEKAGEAGAGLRAKFWVLEFGEASLKGSLSTRNMSTQKVTLTLTPRLERTVVDEQGQAHAISSEVDVSGLVAAAEGRVVIPEVPRPDDAP